MICIATFPGWARRSCAGPDRGHPTLSSMPHRPDIVHTQIVQHKIQHFMEEACLQELAELEKSDIPDIHTSSKKSKIRRTSAAHRLQRRRLVLDGLCEGDGHLVESVAEAGRLLADHWAPVFSCGPKDEQAQRRFVDKVVWVDPHFSFEWPMGRTAELARRPPDTTPGPDGQSYTFWGYLPSPWSGFLDPIALYMSAGIPPPRVLESFTTNIPKAEHREDTDGLAARMAPELRPLVLMQPGAELIAYVATENLAGVAEMTVCGQQRGFVQNRRISDNIV